MNKKYTIIIKKFKLDFIALCLELNVAAQGDSLINAREEIKNAIKEYLDFSKKEKIYSAKLDIDVFQFIQN